MKQPMRDNEEIKLAVKYILQGKIIAFPTETVYGLAGDASNPNAIKKISAIKNRPQNMPYQVMVSSLDKAIALGKFTKNTIALAEIFWPGALTIIVRKKSTYKLAENINPFKNTIGIRIPDHPLALSLLQEIDIPLATTSANISASIPLKTKEEISKNLKGVSLILGKTINNDGIASTVIDCSNEKSYTIIRKGGISKQQMDAVLNSVEN